MSNKIQKGDTILVNYTGKFEDGEVFDSSEGRDPLKFTVGSGQLIPGFDEAVVGMTIGERKTVVIPAEKAYGAHRDDHVLDFPKSNIPEGMEVEEGTQLELMDQDRNPIPAVCIEVLEDIVKIDVNHPLAGKTLTFDIEILKTGLEPDLHSCSAGCTDCGE
jgi:peptidylprolyl isomerase